MWSVTVQGTVRDVDALLTSSLKRLQTAFCQSESAKMRALARHARDEHEWNEGRCNFHLCSCEDEENLQCDYHKVFSVLSFPLAGI